MKKVLIYSSDPLSGVTYCRTHGPLTQLKDKVQYSLFSNRAEEVVHWPWFRSYDLCLMHLAYRIQDVVFAENCKKYGMPLWVDWDDALFHVPVENKHHKIYSSPKTKEYMLAILKMADVITVTSLLEKERFTKEYGISADRILHLPNALDDRLLMHSRAYRGLARRSISWRGSDSHLYDLLTHQSEIREVVNTAAADHFGFFGISPHFMSLELNNWTFYETQNLIDFYMQFCTFNAEVQFVVLMDHYFNRVKSNLAWIDASLAGSVCLAPDFPEFEVPGCVTYKKGNFAKTLLELLETSDSELKRQWKMALDYQKEFLLLSKLNKMRLNIINGL